MKIGQSDEKIDVFPLDSPVEGIVLLNQQLL